MVIVWVNSARIQGGMFRVDLEPGGATEHLSALLTKPSPVSRPPPNDIALYIGHSAYTELSFKRGRFEAGLAAFELRRDSRPESRA